MKSFAIGLIIGILILPVCGWLYFRLGCAPVATAASPMPFERSLADMALSARIRRESPKIVPIQATTENFVAGARIYRENCSFCHGLPGGPDSRAAKGMFPDPPQLFKSGHGVTDDPPGETYWTIANGIRLTGMPGYTTSLTTDQIWQVSLMLARADKLPPQALFTLQPPLTLE